MVGLKDSKVAIVVNNDDLREYTADGNGSGGSQAHRYVEAATGSKFEVRCAFPEKFLETERMPAFALFPMCGRHQRCKCISPGPPMKDAIKTRSSVDEWEMF